MSGDHVTGENLRSFFAAEDWVRYRKRDTTPISPLIELHERAMVVDTKEGEYKLPVGWRGRIALDADGDPYPIEESVFQRTYEPAEEGSLSDSDLDRLVGGSQ